MPERAVIAEREFAALSREEAIALAVRELAEFFPQSGLYLTVVPSYIGGFMALSWAGKGKHLGTPSRIKRAAAAFKKAKLKTTPRRR